MSIRALQKNLGNPCLHSLFRSGCWCNSDAVLHLKFGRKLGHGAGRGLDLQTFKEQPGPWQVLQLALEQASVAFSTIDPVKDYHALGNFFLLCARTKSAK